MKKKRTKTKKASSLKPLHNKKVFSFSSSGGLVEKKPQTLKGLMSKDKAKHTLKQHVRAVRRKHLKKHGTLS